MIALHSMTIVNFITKVYISHFVTFIISAKTATATTFGLILSSGHQFAHSSSLFHSSSLDSSSIIYVSSFYFKFLRCCFIDRKDDNEDEQSLLNPITLSFVLSGSSLTLVSIIWFAYSRKTQHYYEELKRRANYASHKVNILESVEFDVTFDAFFKSVKNCQPVEMQQKFERSMKGTRNSCSVT